MRGIFAAENVITASIALTLTLSLARERGFLGRCSR
jgi:hypothetical protein